MMDSKNSVAIRMVIVAAALGYFVDIYDLLLFSIVRTDSLKDLGIVQNNIAVGLELLNWQLFGLALGGLCWGSLGDKKGRVKVLFGSIIIYSIAYILNAFITNVVEYKALRFLAGFGLAGELGLGITLISECMSTERRGYGAMIVASFGCLGVILAIVIQKSFGWRASFIMGGVMGIVILLLRVMVSESDVFLRIKNLSTDKKGNLLTLLKSFTTLKRYIKCILIGAPTYFVISILMTLAPEFGEHFHLHGVTAGTAILFFYIANTVSDLACPYISQMLKSRKKALTLFLAITFVSTIYFLLQKPATTTLFYVKYIGLGIGVGYWATLLSFIAEQFGTNFRATATTSVPNFIRALGIPIAAAFHVLSNKMGLINGSLLLGMACVLISLAALYTSKATFSKDLAYIE